MAVQTSTDNIQPQTRNSPVIVGDNYELVETVGAGYVGELLGGLLAKPGSPGTLLSMSSYERLPNADLNGKLQAFKAHPYSPSPAPPTCPRDPPLQRVSHSRH